MPLRNIIDDVITINDCDFIIRPRTEKGWTIDLTFNANDYSWSGDSLFYYLGINNEFLPENFIDNNLSFWLTSDRKIKWKTYKFISDTQNKLLMDSSITLCDGATEEYFNITITFKRNREFNDCNLLNKGGSNDLITESKIINPINVLSGSTEEYSYTYGFNEKWVNEVDSRLGTLKMYLNGKPFYSLKNWEEIIPTQRTSTNELTQSWGTGTTGCNDIHNGTCDINIVEINYYEEPLTFIDINKILTLKPYSFNTCENCMDNMSSL